MRNGAIHLFLISVYRDILGIFNCHFTVHLRYQSTCCFRPTLTTVAGLLFIWPIVGMGLNIEIKWAVLGKIKPETYKLWGAYYFRWWFVQHFQQLFFPGSAFIGTPIFNVYCRLMGASIGKNCHIDTSMITAFDLLTIGDDSSVSKSAVLLGYHIENGWLKIGSVTIGNHCFVGVKSALGINTVMEDGSVLEDLSMLPDKGRISQNHHYHGSPAQSIQIKNDSVFNKNLIERTGLWKNIFFGVLHYFSLIFIAIIYTLALFPALLLISYFYHEKTLLSTILFAVPLSSLLFMLCVCFNIVLLKKLLIGKIKPGSYKLKSWFYIRTWIVDRLLALPELEIISESLFFPPLLRLLGMNI